MLSEDGCITKFLTKIKKGFLMTPKRTPVDHGIDIVGDEWEDEENETEKSKNYKQLEFELEYNISDDLVAPI